MARPFRHYCFTLAERLGMSIKTLMTELSSSEISEWMAFDRLKDDDYRESIELKMMTPEQRNQRIIKMLKGG